MHQIYANSNNDKKKKLHFKLHLCQSAQKNYKKIYLKKKK